MFRLSGSTRIDLTLTDWYCILFNVQGTSPDYIFPFLLTLVLMKSFWSQVLKFFSVSGFWQVKHRLPRICSDCDSIVKELGPLVAGIWAHDCHANCMSLW